jgi:hypothetical protein
MSEDKTSRAPVIQIIKGAELTKSEQLLNRVLPACVASAGIHVLLAGGVFALSALAPVGTKAAEPDKVEVAVEESTEKPEDKNLTETTPSINEESTTVTIEEAKIDDKTVQSNVLEKAPAGNDGTQTTPADVLNQLGKDNNAILQGMEPVGPGAGPTKGGGELGLGTISANLVGRGNPTTKAALLKDGGGNAESELAVARGLNWLSKQQVKDVGCWVYDKGNADDTVSATGFALLPFLAAGQTHKPAPGTDDKYKKTVKDGLMYLLKCQKPDGSFRFGKDNELNMYSNGIATVAISEAYGMTGDKTLLLEPLQRAVNFIEGAQSSNGSWNYTVRTDGDTSIVGWQVQALHSAKLCKGIKVNAKVLEKAAKFLDSVASGSSKYKYGYRDATSGAPTTTAVGLLCRYYLNGWGPNSAAMRDGADYLMKSHKPGEKTYDMYYFYYATQVMHFYGGDTWNKEWNPAMRDFLMKQQVKDAKNIKVDGSWDPDKGLHMGPSTGRHGTTCTALLTLEVYYRHLPLYGRGSGGMSDLDGK